MGQQKKLDIQETMRYAVSMMKSTPKVGDLVQNDWNDGDRIVAIGVGGGAVVVVVALGVPAAAVPGGIVACDAIGTIIGTERHNGDLFYRIFYHHGRFNSYQDFIGGKESQGFMVVRSDARFKVVNHV